MAIADINELVEQVVDRVQVDTSLGEGSSIRVPTPPQGKGGHPFLDEITISALTLPLLASLDAKTLAEYFETHGIPFEYFDVSDLPDDIFAGDRKVVPMGVWNSTIVRVHGTLHRLFRAPLAPAALRTVMLSYLSTNVVGLHPADALLFVNALLPGRFTSMEWEFSFLDNLVRYAHYYQAMCPDFLYRLFPGILLTVLGFWMNDYLSAEWDPNRTINVTHTREQ
jgi:hypothetical protein